jgi:hypothetical protein
MMFAYLPPAGVVRYADASLSDLLPSAVAALGVEGEPNALGLDSAESVVFRPAPAPTGLTGHVPAAYRASYSDAASGLPFGSADDDYVDSDECSFETIVVDYYEYPSASATQSVFADVSLTRDINGTMNPNTPGDCTQSPTPEYEAKLALTGDTEHRRDLGWRVRVVPDRR